MTVRLLGMTPMLTVADVQRSTEFYCKAFGFESVGDFHNEDGKLCWTHLKCDMVSLMLTAERDCPADDAVRAARAGTMLYFYPDDVAKLHTSLVAIGLKPDEMRVTPYQMREFSMNDPDGYTLMFGQETTDPPTRWKED